MSASQTQHSAAMEQFREQNKADLVLIKLAEHRDTIARKNHGDKLFVIYGQDSVEVITARAQHPAAQEPAELCEHPTEESKRVCSKCSGFSGRGSEFTRHNQEMHIKDPAMAFFCPVEDCNKVLYRANSSNIDEHLANHLLFPNETEDSVAQKILKGAEDRKLKKLKIAVLITLIEREREAINSTSTTTQAAIRVLQNHPQRSVLVQGLDTPDVSQDLGKMKKKELIEDLIALREYQEKLHEAFAEVVDSFSKNA